MKRLLPLRTYRCAACGWRGFRWTGLRRGGWSASRQRLRRSSLILIAALGLAAALAALFHGRLVAFLAPGQDPGGDTPWEEPPGEEEAPPEEAP